MNTIENFGDYSKITINSKYGIFEVLVDSDDVDKLNKITWHFHYQRNLSNYYISGYDKATKKQAKIHRYIMNAKKGQVVDHINRNTLDNRKCNLRFVTYTESNKNRSSSSYGHKKSNMNLKGLGLYPYKGFMMYDVHLSGCKRKRFEDINEAKAYYIECLLGYNKMEV